MIIVNGPDPKDLSELRSFLGMLNCYGKFLPNLATILSLSTTTVSAMALGTQAKRHSIVSRSYYSRMEF